MLWIFGCMSNMNIRLHFVCLKCVGILIQAPSTIRPVFSIDKQKRMKQKKWVQKKQEKSAQEDRISSHLLDVGIFVKHVSLYAEMSFLSHCTPWKLSSSLAINGIDAMEWNAVTIDAIDCDLLIVTDYLEQNRNQVNALR